MSGIVDHVKRLDESDEAFFIVIDGTIKFKCQREPREKGGRWLVYHSDTDGNPLGDYIDRDLYSNDIIERAVIGKYDRVGSTEVDKSMSWTKPFFHN
jgi:hypothetical protein